MEVVFTSLYHDTCWISLAMEEHHAVLAIKQIQKSHQSFQTLPTMSSTEDSTCLFPVVMRVNIPAIKDHPNSTSFNCWTISSVNCLLKTCVFDHDLFCPVYSAISGAFYSRFLHNKILTNSYASMYCVLLRHWHRDFFPYVHTFCFDAYLQIFRSVLTHITFDHPHSDFR